MNKSSAVLAESIGHAVSVSRRARKMKQSDLASLAGIGMNTMVAIEKGVATVQIGHYLSVLNSLGLESIFKPVINLTADEVGIKSMTALLPKRIDGKRKQRTKSQHDSYID